MKLLKLNLKSILLAAVVLFSGFSHSSEYVDAIQLFNNRNYEQAIIQFHNASNGGEIKAKVYLAEMYRKGLGVNKNLETSYKLYLEAAEANIPFAQNIIGVYHRDGIVVPKNNEVARSWFLKASNGGDENAKTNLTKLPVQTTEKEQANKSVESNAVVPPKRINLDFYGNPMDYNGAVWVSKGTALIGQGTSIGKELSAVYNQIAQIAYERQVVLGRAETAQNMGNIVLAKSLTSQAKSFDGSIIQKSKEFENLWEAQSKDYQMKFLNPENGRYTTILQNKGYYNLWLLINREGHFSSVVLQNGNAPKEIYQTKYDK